MDEGTRDRIEHLVLGIGTLVDVRILDDLMSTSVSNPLLNRSTLSVYIGTGRATGMNDKHS